MSTLTVRIPDELRADYLITGDDDLLMLKHFGQCRIVAPRQFWSLLHQQ